MAHPLQHAESTVVAGRGTLRGLASQVMRTMVFPFALTTGLMIWCYASVGSTLGLFFGGVVSATLVGPALVLAHTGWSNRAQAGGAIIVSAGLTFFVPWYNSVVGLTGCILAVMVLIAYFAAVAAVAVFLDSRRIAPPIAAAAAALVGLLWLAWPVWLAPSLVGDGREQVVAFLTAGHPLLTINGVLLEWLPVPWAQHRLAYVLTNIGDDIPYELPTAVYRCVFVHLSVAMMLLTFARPVGPRTGLPAHRRVG